jgi:hypothetical protein
MTVSTSKMEDLLVKSKVAITNAMSDQEIKTLLLEYNYDDSRLNEGLALLKQAEEVYQKQKKEYREQYVASQELDQSIEKAKPLYTEHVDLTTLAFRHESTKLVDLGLDKIRERTFSAWLIQAIEFYKIVINDETVIEKLSMYNLTKDKLEKGRQLIIEVELANSRQEKEKGEAQDSTKERDKIMAQLEDWMYEFTVICRYALKSKPQLLEKLGIKVKS